MIPPIPKSKGLSRTDPGAGSKNQNSRFGEHEAGGDAGPPIGVLWSYETKELAKDVLQVLEQVVCLQCDVCKVLPSKKLGASCQRACHTGCPVWVSILGA